MIDVTDSKQWIHFFRSDRCPPTSNMLHANESSVTLSRTCDSAKGLGYSLNAQSTRLELCLADSRRLCPSVQNVRLTRYVTSSTYPLNLVKEAGKIRHKASVNCLGRSKRTLCLLGSRIHQVEFTRSIQHARNDRIMPETIYGLYEIW